MLQTETLTVAGMSCGNCKASVEGALNKLAGVNSAAVDLDAGKVEVTYDEAQVTLANMKEAVEDQGYDVE